MFNSRQFLEIIGSYHEKFAKVAEIHETLTLFRTESEYPYHVRGGAPEATPCISGTIHQKVTKLLEHTYVGKCRGFKA